VDDFDIAQIRFELPLAKAQSLLSSRYLPRKGGDKQKFWAIITGFTSPAVLRLAILSAMNLACNEFDKLDRASIELSSATGVIWQIRTVWIMPFDQPVARFVAAFPDRLRGLP